MSYLHCLFQMSLLLFLFWTFSELLWRRREHFPLTSPQAFFCTPLHISQTQSRRVEPLSWQIPGYHSDHIFLITCFPFSWTCGWTFWVNPCLHMNCSKIEFILKEVVWILLENRNVLDYALTKRNRVTRAKSLKIQLCWVQSSVQGPSAELAQKWRSRPPHCNQISKFRDICGKWVVISSQQLFLLWRMAFSLSTDTSVSRRRAIKEEVAPQHFFPGTAPFPGCPIFTNWQASSLRSDIHLEIRNLSYLRARGKKKWVSESWKRKPYLT